MRLPRLSPVVLSLALSLSLVLCWCTQEVRGQAYVPMPVPLTQCPPGQQLLTLGSMDLTNTTLFPDNDGNSFLFADDYDIYITPFTLRGQNAFGVTIYQMAVHLFDMRFWLGSPAKIRLAIYLSQEAEKSSLTFDLAAVVAMTDEITVRHTNTRLVLARLGQHGTFA